VHANAVIAGWPSGQALWIIACGNAVISPHNIILFNDSSAPHVSIRLA